jgi:hypothetical protein
MTNSEDPRPDWEAQHERRRRDGHESNHQPQHEENERPLGVPLYDIPGRPLPRLYFYSHGDSQAPFRRLRAKTGEIVIATDHNGGQTVKLEFKVDNPGDGLVDYKC